MPVKCANSEAEILGCFAIASQLRSHLTASEFLKKVQQQQQSGYHLVDLEEEKIRGIAGFRILDPLAYGKLLYVDDLVTARSERSQGYGSVLFSWLVNYAQAQKCSSLQLDSGIHRTHAHRFYFKRMAIASFRFVLPL